jgi:hypothetical protein
MTRRSHRTPASLAVVLLAAMILADCSASEPAQPAPVPVAFDQAGFRRVINRAQSDFQQEGVIRQLAVPTPASGSPTPAATAPPAGCIDGMAWVADLTKDDWEMMAPPMLTPGQPFVKAWRVRNSGTCTWDDTYFLGYDHGNVPAAQMDGRPAHVVGTVAPGATYDFSVNLVAPSAPGVYQGLWQMRNGKAAPFGETIWVAICVPAYPPPRPGPNATLGPYISFTANPAGIQQGQCGPVSWSTSNVQPVYSHHAGQD